MMNCASKDFRALSLATWTSAFNEIAFKIAIFLLAATSPQKQVSIPVLFVALGILPVLPSVFLSPVSGIIADRHSKRRVIQFAKFIEIIFVLFGGYFVAQYKLMPAFIVVFLLGVCHAISTPAKYALLPEILDSQNLSRGNGFIIFAKYSAFLIGILIVSTLVLMRIDMPIVLASLTASISVVGFVASLFLTQEAAHQFDKSFTWGRGIVQYFQEIKGNKELFLTMTSFAFFLILGYLFQLNTTLFLEPDVGFTRTQTTLLLCALSFGIAGGGLIAGRISLSKVEIGIVPVSALGVALGLFFSALALKTYSVLFVLYLFTGLCGGTGIVPLYALFQQKSPLEKRGAYLGISQAFSHIGLLFILLFILAIQKSWGLSPGALFILVAVITLITAVYTLTLVPRAFIRCINWIFATSLYRINVIGLENVPSHGGALLVCNHISYFDPLLIAASLQRGIRFLIYRPLFNHPIMRPLLHLIRAIPISPKDPPRVLVSSLKEARETIERGGLVCVFAEGEPSRIGHMIRFSRGLEAIIKGTHVPIIPTYIDQTWGSLFKVRNGRYRFRFPKELPYPASVTFGDALPADASVFEVRQKISELGTTAFSSRKKEYQFLHFGFIRAAKQHPFRTCMIEASGKRVNNLKALVESFLFADVLKQKLLPDVNCVGILLPPCIAATLANIAILFRGRIPVNFNYTAGKEASASAISQAKIRQVITSKLVLSKITPPEGVDFIYAEDIAEAIKPMHKFFALLYVSLLPSRILYHFVHAAGASHEDPATYVFSSGSTGIPKGIVLSHGNISSNVTSTYDDVGINNNDMIVGVLPFFHSFGLTTGLWLPILSRVPVVYHFSPLDAETVGKMVAREKATILLSTPTFLMSYVKKIPPRQFASLRLAVVGAEKLRPHIARAFEEKFGFIPLEGYGCTELSPVAMINVPDVKENTTEQIGHKPGTVGHPIPGVAVKVIDPDTHQELKAGEMGLLFVKGPNVMKGYLNSPEKTAEVIIDGWYNTGDLASIDTDGFVTLHDRLSRFSKIAGEMVPHGAVEDAIQGILGEVEQICVVSCVPDHQRGEKLIVLHTKEFDPRFMVRKLSEVGLPNLWIPKAGDFYLIGTIPVLASGKLDLQSVKAKAKEMAG